LSVSQAKWKVEHLDHVDSTNTWLVQRARDGAAEGLAVYADFQSAGRGRLERTWVAPANSSLLCSVLLRPPCDAPATQLIVQSAALAMCDALEELTATRPRLKWPNDILYGEAKVAGLLAEAVDDKVVVGLGLNLTDVDPSFDMATTVLAATGEPLEPARVLRSYLDALARRRDSIESPEGRAQVREDYLAALSTLGRDVRASLFTGDVCGRAVGVDESGALLVDTGDDVRVITAGDVVHLRSNRAEGIGGTERNETFQHTDRDHDASDGRGEEQG
jgi:BirA family biotin operon repressor/biotin-[acetyl-CoA-carboxylase] ligase